MTIFFEVFWSKNYFIFHKIYTNHNHNQLINRQLSNENSIKKLKKIEQSLFFVLEKTIFYLDYCSMKSDTKEVTQN